jgi:penicillin amidase
MLGRWFRRGALLSGVLFALALLVALAYAARVAWFTRTALAAVAGTQAGLALDGPVTIARDGRGVPHIRAGSDRDLFFAEGYAMAADRLFQMDLTRRFVDGRLAELLGPPLLAVDRRMRRYGVAELAEKTYARGTAQSRAYLQAFAAGINAAAAREPLPPEYRALFARFEPWRPEDAMAVGYATVLDLDDNADAILGRERIHRLLGDAGTDAFLPLTDPRYDVPTDGSAPGPIASLPPLSGARAVAALPEVEEKAPVGSNGWAAGAARTASGRAVLANDPHLSLGIPTIWWLVEARSPHFHVAGAALAGTPGVTLGHDEHLAWGVTAGETAAMRLLRERARGADELFEHGRWVHARHRRERYRVRLRADVTADVLETPHGTLIAREGDVAYLMDWRLRHAAGSPLDAFLALDRARGVEDGLAALRDLPEPALNVLLADDGGRVAYHLAGGIPLESAWGRYAVDGDAPVPPLLPFARAPHVDPSREALIVSGNNRAEGAGGPRLAPFWPPPYRAYELRRALGAARDARGKLSVEALAAAQRDASSPAELEFARLALAALTRAHAEADPALRPALSALRQFDGQVLPASRGATVVVALRRDLLRAFAAAHLPADVVREYTAGTGNFVVPLRALRERPRGWVPGDDYDGFVLAALRRVQSALGSEIPTFGSYGAQPLAHPLAPLGFTFWNGPTFPGRGGSFAPAVQWRSHGQSFRAVWIAGDWDAGTIDIDAGESGRPGSPHYRDQAAGWARFARTTLPFSDAAVRAATRSVLTLTP